MLKLVLLVALLAVAPSDAHIKKLLLKKAISGLVPPLQLPRIFGGKNLLPIFGSNPTSEVEVSVEEDVAKPPAETVEPVEIVEDVPAPSGGDGSSVRPIFQSFPVPYYYVPVSTYSVASSYAYPYSNSYPYSYTSYSDSEPRYLYEAPSTW